MRAAVSLWDQVRYDGRDWQVVAVSKDLVTLNALDNGQTREVTQGTVMAAEDALLLTPPVLPDLDRVDLLAMLAAPMRERVLLLEAHLREVLTGQPCSALAGAARRPQYQPDQRLADRVVAKAAELTAAGTPTTARSIWRHLAAYRAKGVNGLVDARSTPAASATGRVGPELIAIIEDELGGQTARSTGTRSRAISHIEDTAAAQGVAVPSRATLYRVIGNLERQRHPFGNATTRRTQANRPDRAYGRQTPFRPGELVEIDSTPLDLLVLYPDATTGRADLTVALDVATRTVMAALLRPVATKAVDAAVLLARAMTPLPLQPGWAESLAYSRQLLPPTPCLTTRSCLTICTPGR